MGNQFIFDHPALQHWNIPISDLPSDSIIKNRQDYLWETYRLQIIFVISVFVLLILLVGTLFLITRRLTLARLKLKNLNSNLEIQVNERTTALSQTNIRLQEEIQERTQIGETLRQYTLQLEAMQIRLQEQTIRDPLTGAFNRRYLIETLEREIANAVRSQYQLGLMIMDIDHFKKINDTYGHQTGDYVLVNLVKLLEKSTRKGDIVCRYGGEEFAVLLPHISLNDAVDRAESWRKTLENTVFQSFGKPISITISVGVAVNGKPEMNGDELLFHADKALLVAKKTGRNRVVAEGKSKA
jgi:diguanylate cyclase (GGDEF)-like protein